MLDKSIAGVLTPENTVIRLGDEEHRLIYDMGAFCALEKVYGSVDVVLKMLFGATAEKVAPIVTYNDAVVNATEIKVDNVQLNEILKERDSSIRVAKHSDTFELVWAGMIHDNAIYNADDEIVGYKISRRQVSEQITFRNYSELNIKIVESIIRDLAPQSSADAKSDEKNATAATAATANLQLVQTQ